MKKILIALLFAATGQMSAIAQNTESRVCTASSKNGVSCYRTRYAENFKVCPTNRGYTICGETPTNTNSTRSGYVASLEATQEDMSQYNERYVLRSRTAPEGQYVDVPGSVAMVSAEAGSQSYPTGYVADLDKSADFGASTSSSYAGYKPGTSCYTGDNVAENNKAPYKGCPSPQDDGPQKNNYRNMNFANPVGLPPLAGRPE